MAEGGDYFGYKDPDLDNAIDNDDDFDPNSYDDDSVNEQLNQTQTFNPGRASTPYQTTMHEQSGLPDTSFTENAPLLNEQRNSWTVLTDIFPYASATDLEVSYIIDKKLQVKRLGLEKKLIPFSPMIGRAINN